MIRLFVQPPTIVYMQFLFESIQRFLRSSSNTPFGIFKSMFDPMGMSTI